MDINRRKALDSLEGDKARLFSLAQRLSSNAELGFFEYKTLEILVEELRATGARISTGFARTGLMAELGKGGASDPAIVLLADMDALPTQGAEGGVCHSCGHHAQMAVMLGAFRALAEAGAADLGAVRIIFAASPAEEYVDLERRRALREGGQIVYLSGKQEMIRADVFPASSLVLKYHSMADSPERQATVNGTLNGFMAKRAEFTGKASHAGAQPHKGVNALTAAVLALQAVDAQRSTFRDEDHIRVHPILQEGGTTINSVPARAVVETYVRGASHEAVVQAAAKVDRAFRAGALALGASLDIHDSPGYQAFRPSPALGSVLGAAAGELLPESAIDFSDASYASDDIGDVACLHPTCQLGFSGFSGTIHNEDFRCADPERAYFLPAAILLRTALALVAGEGAEARSILAGFTPRFSRKEYLQALDSLFSSRRYPGEA